MRKIKSLLEPITIGRVSLKNRLILAPLSMYLADNCLVSQRLIDFYVERARGDVGLIICTFAALQLAEGGPWKDYIPSIYDDRQVPEIRKLVRAIHDNGAKACIQLYCPADWPGGDSVGPSAVTVLRAHLPPVVPRELSIEEIKRTIGEIAEACRRSREAGFDMVQFHAIGGECFISRFLATVTNARTDQYGGSLENRLGVLIEILDESKQKAGNDFTFIARISGDGFRDGTPTLAEQKKAAVILEAAGFDALEIKPGWRGQNISTIDQPEGAFAYLAAEIKKQVAVPIITGTRYVNPLIADQVIGEGSADMVSMGRALIADPGLCRKMKENRMQEILPCTGCQWCVKRISEASSIECSVNARAAGKESSRIGQTGLQKYKPNTVAEMRGAFMSESVSDCRTFSHLAHVSVVVKDMEESVAYYHSLGIGPFREPAHHDFAIKTLRGASLDSELVIKETSIGSVTLQLVQHIRGAHIVKEFIDRKGYGVYHLGFQVNNIELHENTMIEKGVGVIQKGRRGDGSGYSYFDTAARAGIILEIKENPIDR